MFLLQVTRMVIATGEIQNDQQTRAARRALEWRFYKDKLVKSLKLYNRVQYFLCYRTGGRIQTMRLTQKYRLVKNALHCLSPLRVDLFVHFWAIHVDGGHRPHRR